MAVETADFLKNRTPYGPAARPEGESRFLTCLVDVVVQQVAVLRQKIRLRRGGIVGTKQGSRLWILLELALYTVH